MGQALYRKYRSKSLSEIVGQEHVTDTLTTALAKDRISHAYLLSGPRGVGKTSIARILAHQLNNLPYTDDAAHLDIIEIDAASNRRIDEIRDLRDKVYIAPTSGRFKVYIIDEVHMLTREAFNALLKTLEEPPSHVVFILATTEAHKLPDTIISRTQHYVFKPVTREKVIAHLKHIAAEESIDIDDKALGLLADFGGGSFRDSISLLDQARSTAQKIDADQVRRVLGIAPDTAVHEIISCVASPGATSQLMQLIESLFGQGLQAASIGSQLSAVLRASIIKNKPLLPVDQTLRLMKSLLEVPASKNPERLLEIVLLEASATDDSRSTNSHIPRASMDTSEAVNAPPTEQYPQSIVKIEQPSNPATKPVSSRSRSSIAPPVPITAAVDIVLPSGATDSKTAITQTVSKSTTADNGLSASMQVVALNDAVWTQILNSIKKDYNTLYGVLRMARPVFNAEGIELQMKFAFHQKRLNEVKNKQIIAGFIKQITGVDYQVVCTYAPAVAPGTQAGHKPVKAGAQPAELEAISNIFGGGELL